MVHLAKIIAAILVLLGIALGIYAWMLGTKPVAKPVVAAAPPTYAVVVAAKPLPVGQAIKAEDLRIEQLPMRPADAFLETGLVAGRVPVMDVGEGVPLVEPQLATGLSIKISEGERAVAIKVDEVVGVGNKVRPGDFVDVFFILKRDGAEVDRSQARLLLSRKRVLAYGGSSVDGIESTQAQQAGGARTAILAVPLDEVNPLVLGEANGRLLLALRNPKDTTVPDASAPVAWMQASLPGARKPGQTPTGTDRALAGTALADLAGRGQAAPATPQVRTPTVQRAQGRATGKPVAPAELLNVEVIRGAKQETLTY
jgi:pilus assembly protein CpaB